MHRRCCFSSANVKTYSLALKTSITKIDLRGLRRPSYIAGTWSALIQGSVPFRPRWYSTSKKPKYREIRFPDTSRGRKGMKEAIQFWEDSWRKLEGRPPSYDMVKIKKTFCIDDNNSSKTLVKLDGVIFAVNNPTGERLWRLANPIPRAKKPRGFRWSAYVGGAYISTGVLQS